MEAAVNHLRMALPHIGRRVGFAEVLGILLCLYDDGESSSWMEVAEEGGDLGEMLSRRGRDDAAEELEEFDAGRGGVVESMMVGKERKQSQWERGGNLTSIA